MAVSCKPLSAKQVELIVSVSDTGIGIPKENITSIFEPFIQADQTTTRKFGGTGLGLTITKRLVHLMNGHIHVEFEVGKGSKFSLTLNLPITDKANI